MAEQPSLQSSWLWFERQRLVQLSTSPKKQRTTVLGGSRRRRATTVLAEVPAGEARVLFKIPDDFHPPFALAHVDASDNGYVFGKVELAPGAEFSPQMISETPPVVGWAATDWDEISVAQFYRTENEFRISSAPHLLAADKRQFALSPCDGVSDWLLTPKDKRYQGPTKCVIAPPIKPFVLVDFEHVWTTRPHLVVTVHDAARIVHQATLTWCRYQLNETQTLDLARDSDGLMQISLEEIQMRDHVKIAFEGHRKDVEFLYRAKFPHYTTFDELGPREGANSITEIRSRGINQSDYSHEFWSISEQPTCAAAPPPRLFSSHSDLMCALQQSTAKSIADDQFSRLHDLPSAVSWMFLNLALCGKVFQRAFHFLREPTEGVIDTFLRCPQDLLLLVRSPRILDFAKRKLPGPLTTLKLVADNCDHAKRRKEIEQYLVANDDCELNFWAESLSSGTPIEVLRQYRVVEGWRVGQNEMLTNGILQSHLKYPSHDNLFAELLADVDSPLHEAGRIAMQHRSRALAPNSTIEEVHHALQVMGEFHRLFANHLEALQTHRPPQGDWDQLQGARDSLSQDWIATTVRELNEFHRNGSDLLVPEGVDPPCLLKADAALFWRFGNVDEVESDPEPEPNSPFDFLKN